MWASELQRQVNEYFAYLWTCMRGLGESDVMGSLPVSLRRQLAIALNRKLFLNVRLFHECDGAVTLALAGPCLVAPCHTAALAALAAALQNELLAVVTRNSATANASTEVVTRRRETRWSKDLAATIATTSKRLRLRFVAHPQTLGACSVEHPD